MKVYKIELLVIDFDDVGESGIKDVIENAHYPNHCITPDIKNIESREVEWADSHPLNNRSTCDSAYIELFSKAKS